MESKKSKRSPRATTDANKPTLDSLLAQASRNSTADLRRVVKSEDIPVEFWRVLEVLSDERGRSITALAQSLGMALPATSKVIDRMTENALLQRAIDPTDQRRVFIYISDFGLEKVRSLQARVADYRDQIEQHFSANQMNDLRALLHDFIEARDRAFRQR